jgi:hypothetical protein
MRHAFLALVIGLAIGSGPIQAQAPAVIAVSPPRVRTYYAAPGYYGTTYGVASFGSRQTYSTFASPYGAGYSYGYPPATFLPGPYGAGLWRPGQATVWRTPYYGTYATPAAPRGVPLPPIGVYAPGFGPGIPPTVYGR